MSSLLAAVSSKNFRESLMILSASGGVHIRDKEFLHEILADLHAQDPIELYIENGNEGVERTIRHWTESKGIHTMTIRPLWTVLPSPFRRRNEVAMNFLPDVVISAGEEPAAIDLLQRALKMKILVIRITQKKGKLPHVRLLKPE